MHRVPLGCGNSFPLAYASLIGAAAEKRWPLTFSSCVSVLPAPCRLCNAGTPGSIQFGPGRMRISRNQLTGTVVLDPDCYYEQKFKIKEPDTVLDCNSAELQGRQLSAGY